MSLSAYQLSYNGLTFGEGCDVQLVSAEGLREAPPVRSGDVPKPRRHGAWAGLNPFGERIITLTLQVFGETSQPFETVLAGVTKAFANISDPAGLLPLQFMMPGWATARQVTGRPTKGGWPVDTSYAARKATIPVEFTCPDPLIYDTATQSPSAGLPSPTAGLSFPVGFNVGFGASSGGSLHLANAGNEGLPPVWTFTGPITWPTLTLGSASLGFEITLNSGDTLVVDCRNRTVVLNGTASRFGTVMTGSSFFTIPPGGATVGFSSVDSTQVSGTVTAANQPTGAWGWC